jgi:hypothetical protein
MGGITPIEQLTKQNENIAWTENVRPREVRQRVRFLHTAGSLKAGRGATKQTT